MKVLILTNGDYGDYLFCKDLTGYDQIICADNGMHHARKLELLPDLIIGDFDSCNGEDRHYFEALNVRFEQMPSQKDETDTELAVLYAKEQGAVEIDIYGGVGSRMDHSIANMQLIYRCLKEGIKATLYSGKNKIQMIDHHVRLEGMVNDLVSLMPFTEEVTGVTTKGLAYELYEGTFKLGDAFGVSNYMLETEATITVQKGVLVVMCTKD